MSSLVVNKLFQDIFNIERLCKIEFNYKYISKIIYEFLQIHFFLVPLRFLDTSGLPFQRKLTRAEENRLKSFSSTYSLSSSHIFRVSSDYGRKYRFRSRFGRLHNSPLCNGRLWHCVMAQYA